MKKDPNSENSPLTVITTIVMLAIAATLAGTVFNEVSNRHEQEIKRIELQIIQAQNEQKILKQD